MSASTWPEQDAIDTWWNANSLSLKRAATEYRIRRDKQMSQLHDVLLNALDQCEAGDADEAAKILKEALSEFDSE